MFTFFFFSNFFFSLSLLVSISYLSLQLHYKVANNKKKKEYTYQLAFVLHQLIFIPKNPMCHRLLPQNLKRTILCL